MLISTNNNKNTTFCHPVTIGVAKSLVIQRPVTLNLFQGLTKPPQYKYNLQTDTISFSGRRQEKSKEKEQEIDLKSSQNSNAYKEKKARWVQKQQLKKEIEAFRKENPDMPEAEIIEIVKAKTVQKINTTPLQPPEQEEKSFISKLNKIDITTIKICLFLDGIKEKSDFKLKTKEKNQLKEAEKQLAEKTVYLQTLSEQIKKEDEKQKLELVKKNLNKLNEILAARKILNAEKQPQKPVVYVDMPVQTKKQPVQKPETPVKTEIERLNQVKGSKNLARQRDLLVKKVCGINEKLNKITEFLITIEKKHDSLLKPKDRNLLSQVKPVLAKAEDQLVKIKEQAEKIKEQNQKEINIQHTREKIEQINQTLKARAQIKLSDCKQHATGLTALVDLTYKNNLNLKSTPNFSDEDFKKNLQTNVLGITNTNKAAKRISSLSIYLKEKMIGFEVPEYELKEEKKGGYQWFERGLENLLIGSKKANLKPEAYKDTAKELFGILAVHDNYWKSSEFSDYLSSLKTSKTITENQTKAVDATVLAIRELNEPKQLGFGAQEMISMGERAFTPMKFIHEIYEKCAYTGNHLDRESDDENFRPSADHIIPHSWENSKNDDGNFIISSMDSNTDRGNIALIKYLKGNDGI